MAISPNNLRSSISVDVDRANSIEKYVDNKLEKEYTLDKHGYVAVEIPSRYTIGTGTMQILTDRYLSAGWHRVKVENRQTGIQEWNWYICLWAN